MKKILLIFFMVFILVVKVDASDINTNLNTLNQKTSELEERMNNYENSRLDKTYPIGSIYETTTYSTAADVNIALGGTWEVYGSGRILVGINTSDSNFNVVGKTGGVSSISLTTANLPSHSHRIPALSGTAASAGAHMHYIQAYYDQTGYGVTIPAKTSYFMQVGWAFSGTSSIANMNRMNGVYTVSDGAHTHTVTTSASTTGGTGTASSFTNLQPSIAVYRYKRIS